MSYANVTKTNAQRIRSNVDADYINALPDEAKQYLFGPVPPGTQPSPPSCMMDNIFDNPITYEIPNIKNMEKCKSLTEAYIALEIENRESILSDINHTIHIDRRKNKLTFTVGDQCSADALKALKLKFLGNEYHFPNNERLQFNWIKINKSLSTQETIILNKYLMSQGVQGYITQPSAHHTSYQRRQETYVIFSGTTPPKFFVQGTTATRILNIAGLDPLLIFYMNPILNSINHPFATKDSKGSQPKGVKSTKPSPKSTNVQRTNNSNAPTTTPTNHHESTSEATADEANSATPDNQESDVTSESITWQQIDGKKFVIDTDIPIDPTFSPPAMCLPTNNRYSVLYDAEDEDLSYENPITMVTKVFPTLNLQGVGDPQRYKPISLPKHDSSLSKDQIKTMSSADDLKLIEAAVSSASIQHAETPIQRLSPLNKHLLIWNKSLLAKLRAKISLLRLIRTSCDAHIQKNISISNIVDNLETKYQVQLLNSKNIEDSLIKILGTHLHISKASIDLFIASSCMEMIIRILCPAIYYDDLALESLTGRPTYRASNKCLQDEFIYDLLSNAEFASQLKHIYPPCQHMVEAIQQSSPPQSMFISVKLL